MSTSIPDLLRHTVARRGSAVALVAGDESMTFAELDRASNRFAAFLVSVGVAPEDRVIVACENGLPAAIAYIGTLKAHAVPVMLHGQTREIRMRRVIASARPVAAVVDPGAGAALVAVLPDAPTVRHVIPVSPNTVVTTTKSTLFADAIRFEGRAPSFEADPDSLATLLYTSGTTGEPKGVMHSHATLVAATESIVAYLGIHENDAIFNVLQLSFGYGLTQLLISIRTGAKLILERSITYPADTLKRAALHQPTVWPGVPTIWAAMLTLSGFAETSIPSMRLITNAGDGLAPALGRALCERFPSMNLVPMYGQTEIIRGTYLPSVEYARRPTSSGIAIPGSEIWLVDEAGERLPLGSTGELYFRGPTVMIGYWEKPELTESKLLRHEDEPHRTLKTGDVFRTDADGFLYFVARGDDIIKSRGEKIAPKEVENALLELPEVRECCVVGVPDERLGQAVKAFVVFRDEKTLEPKVIQRFLASRLEPYMVPQQVEVVAALPKTESGKIRAALLLEGKNDGSARSNP